MNQANASREKAIADPEHHDQWIDEAIEWLEQAMEAGRCAVTTVEADDPPPAPEPVGTAASETFASPWRVIARQ
ncbi:hypothetical protein [Bradyrhizobium liaoningense]|uniref:hypothetical protein n=1 Tax=Bradyrhizobium liaoningense TaxID=43992 RepID=UPI001BA4BA19|nr:hypothetical protein [Bradyrhizobium liaoningense]